METGINNNTLVQIVIDIPRNPAMWPVGEMFFWGHKGMTLDSSKNL